MQSKYVLVIGLVVAMGASIAPAQVINQDQKLVPDDGGEEDNFGESVAISGGVAVVGTPQDDDNGDQSGSAYVFDAQTGQQLFKLLADDGFGGDRFGASVAVSGGMVVVGASQDSDNGAFSGSAYVFDAQTGQQLFKLLPDDGASRDRFGFSVAISGGVAVVGAFADGDNGFASGSAYLFDVKTGEQLFKLLPSDGARADFFGDSVGISGSVAIVGAPQDTDNGSQSGSAYLFDVKTGEQLAKLLPDDGAAGDLFGHSVAIGGGVAVVGAWSDNDNGGQSGSAYLFDVKTGEQLAKLLPDDGAAGDRFGESVAIGAGVAIVGAWSDNDKNNGNASGSAYVFDAQTGAQLAKLLADDGTAGDSLGFGVSISCSTVVAGAYRDDDRGSAYTFTVPVRETCPGDWDRNCVVNAADVGAFLSTYFDDLANGTLNADFDENGVVNAADVGAFLSTYFNSLGACA